MGDLNAKMSPENTLLENVIKRHGFGDRNDNDERFVQLSSPQDWRHIVPAQSLPQGQLHFN